MHTDWLKVSELRGVSAGAQEDEWQVWASLAVAAAVPTDRVRAAVQEVGSKNKARVRQAALDFVPSPASDVFGGRTRVLLSRRGVPDSVSTEPFFALHIDPAPTVEEALARMASLSEVSGVRNQRSQREIAAAQSHTLERLPAALVLHVKRFSVAPDGQPLKLHAPVRFGLELDTDPAWLSAGVAPARYRLLAAVCHHGARVDGGHYTAYVRRGDQWLHIDDVEVAPVSAAAVRLAAQTVYLLVYESCGLGGRPRHQPHLQHEPQAQLALLWCRGRAHAHGTLDALGLGVVRFDRGLLRVRASRQPADRDFQARAHPKGRHYGLPALRQLYDLERHHVPGLLRKSAGASLTASARLPSERRTQGPWGTCRSRSRVPQASGWPWSQQAVAVRRLHRAAPGSHAHSARRAQRAPHRQS